MIDNFFLLHVVVHLELHLETNLVIAPFHALVFFISGNAVVEKDLGVHGAGHLVFLAVRDAR
jgi:hypothetical protein